MRQRRPEVLSPQGRGSVLAGHPSQPLLFCDERDGRVVRVWDLERRVTRHVLGGHEHEVSGLAVDPHGPRCASGSWDKVVRVWNLENGECLRTLEGHQNCVNAVAWAPSGRLLASGGRDRTVRLWDPDSGALRAVLEGHGHWIGVLATHPETASDLLASGSNDGTVRLWRWSSGELVRLLDAWGMVSSLVASRDWLVSGSMRGVIRVWSWEGVCAREIEFKLAPALQSMAWEGPLLAALNFDGRVAVWNTGASDPDAWTTRALAQSANPHNGVAVQGGRVAFFSRRAPWGLVLVAFETPREARIRRRRLAAAR